jgi:hypothetical protein
MSIDITPADVLHLDYVTDEVPAIDRPIVKGKHLATVTVNDDETLSATWHGVTVTGTDRTALKHALYPMWRAYDVERLNALYAVLPGTVAITD